MDLPDTICGPRLTTTSIFVCWLRKHQLGPHIALNINGMGMGIALSIDVNGDLSLPTLADRPLLEEATQAYMEFVHG